MPVSDKCVGLFLLLIFITPSIFVAFWVSFSILHHRPAFTLAFRLAFGLAFGVGA